MKRHVAIAVLLVLLAGLYGFLGALVDQNPYSLGTPKESGAPKGYRSSWEPSIIWLPSYLVCQLHIGMSFDKLGYSLASDSDRHIYVCASSLMGAMIGIFIVAAAVIVLFGRRLEFQKQPIQHSVMALSGLILLAISLMLLGKRGDWLQWYGIIAGGMAEIAFVMFILITIMNASKAPPTYRR